MDNRTQFNAFAERRFRLAGRDLLPAIEHFMGPFDSLPRPADGRPLVGFSHYDYLGLVRDPRVLAAAEAVMHTHGIGVSASRIVGGERVLHKDLEKDLAEFLGYQACLTLVSGYLTNSTVIAHVLGARDLLIVDELSHNSILAGAAGAKATKMVFRHNDLAHLEEVLQEQRGKFRNCLIVVEGLYSMDGDVPDLPAILEMKERHGCWLLVDEAHSLGVLGNTGRGISEHFGTDPERIDLVIGTLSKTLVTCGGFVAGGRVVMDWFRYTLPGFVFSVGLPSPVAAGAHEALRIMRAEPERVARLRSNSEFAVAEARELGLDTGPAIGRGVIPLLFQDVQATVTAATVMLAAGYYCPPIVQVGVPRDLPRLRMFLSAAHTRSQISGALAAAAASREAALPANGAVPAAWRMSA